jgi:hypothetical protein
MSIRSRLCLTCFAVLFAVSILAAAAGAEVAQQGNLRVTATGKLTPKALPRTGTAPISVSVGGQIATTDETLPPLLTTLRVELNRYGRLDYEGLPVCQYGKIQPGSSSHALAGCRSALVGSGTFSADITLAGQESYPVKGKLLVFNGVQNGKPVLYGHIYAPHPFATSFVIVFKVGQVSKGDYGIVFDAPLPKAMKTWGRLTGLQMTLNRHFKYKGKSHSYISSGCPAPKGFATAPFPLARTSFAFAGGQKLSLVVSGTCKVRG